MCGRFQFVPKVGESLAEQFGLDALPAWEPRWNLAPTQAIPVLWAGTEGGDDRRDGAPSPGLPTAGSMRWGLVPPWAKQPPALGGFINARLETAASKPSFRDAWSHRRCLIPATGYYEWARKGGPPTLLSRPDGACFFLAGLWQPPSAAQEQASCTILTTAAQGELEALHPRMPLMLARREGRPWLAGILPARAESGNYLPPFTLRQNQVSRRLNRVQAEGPELMVPEEGPSLFD